MKAQQKLILVCLTWIFVFTFSTLQAQEIKTDQYVVLQMPGSPIKIVLAKQVEVKDNVFTLTDTQNKTQRYQKSFLVGSVAYYDDKAKEGLKDEEIAEVLESYTKLVAQFPESKKVLEPESYKLQKFVELRKQQAIEKEAKKQETLAKALSLVFDDARNYTLAEIEEIINQTKETIKDYSELNSQVEAHLAPWIERQGHLQAGKKRFEGEWKTRDEIRSIQDTRADAEQEKFFKTNAKLVFTSLVIPQASMLLTLGIVVITLLSVIYSFFYLATARGGNLTFGGAIILLVGLAILGLYGYYGIKIFNFTTSADEYWKDAYKIEVPEDQLPNPFPRMLFMSSGSENRRIKNSDSRVVLGDTQLNVLMRKHLKIQRSDAAQILDLERNKILVRFYSDRIEFIDEVVCMGMRMLLRYEILHKTDGKTLSFYDQNVYLGGAQLPSSLGSFMFKQFLRQLQNSLKTSNIPALYSIEKVEGGSISLIWPLPTGKLKGTPDAGVKNPTSESATPVSGEPATSAPADAPASSP